MTEQISSIIIEKKKKKKLNQNKKIAFMNQKSNRKSMLGKIRIYISFKPEMVLMLTPSNCQCSIFIKRKLIYPNFSSFIPKIGTKSFPCYCVWNASEFVDNWGKMRRNSFSWCTNAVLAYAQRPVEASKERYIGPQSFEFYSTLRAYMYV